jgi:prepilin-type N-terminal cleavage/methylation domain-containing protein
VSKWSSRLRRAASESRGFGLIEIVVAMFLLAILSLSVLPILAQGVKQSAANAALASATQLANQQIELVRSQTACAALVPATVSVTTQGVPLRASRTIGSCPASGYPLTVRVSVNVTRTDTGVSLASATTLVFATGP